MDIDPNKTYLISGHNLMLLITTTAHLIMTDESGDVGQCIHNDVETLKSIIGSYINEDSGDRIKINN